MRLLRLERLAPAVLLCLFDGIPSVVHIEEPRQGVQFGFDADDQADGRAAASSRPRNADDLRGPARRRPSSTCRSGAGGASGVVDIQQLERRARGHAGSTGAATASTARSTPCSSSASRTGRSGATATPTSERSARCSSRPSSTRRMVDARRSSEVPDGRLPIDRRSSPRRPSLDRASTALGQARRRHRHVGPGTSGCRASTRILVPVDVQAYVVPGGGAEADRRRRRRRRATRRRSPPAPCARPGCTCTGRCRTRCCAADARRGRPATPELPRAPGPVGRGPHAAARTARGRCSPRGGSSTRAPGSSRRCRRIAGTAADRAASGRRSTRSTASAAAPDVDRDVRRRAQPVRLPRPARRPAALREVAPHGFHGDQAVYTVAGWWSDPAHDPLAGARGQAALDARLAELGW